MAFHKYHVDSKMFEYDRHYKTCKEQDRPCIRARINPEHNNYLVQIDMLTCSYNLSDIQQKKIQMLVQKETEYLKVMYGSSLENFNIDKELGWFDGIPSEHADEFCNALYKITAKDSARTV